MKRRTESIEAIAYHEAGHAVANIVLGFAPERCTIVPGEDFLGCVSGPNSVFGYYGSGRRERESRARDAIVTLYAGLAAEHLFCGTVFSFDNEAKHGAWGDHNQAWELLREHCRVRGCQWVGDEKYWAALERLQREALKLVRRHHAAIERVAKMLLSRRTLTGEEVRVVVEGTSEK